MAVNQIPQLTDLGNAVEFSRHHRGNVIYVREWKQWLIRNEKRWKPDTDGELSSCTKYTINSLVAQCGKQMEVKNRHTLESLQRIEAMLTLAKDEPGMAISAEEFDIDPWELNCGNGVLNLKTGSMKKHDRGQMLTHVAGCDYVPTARSSLWERFLRDIMDGEEELIWYLKKAVGYSLTGMTDEQCLFILYGEGSNGKSRFIEAVRSMLGEYAKATAPATLMRQRPEAIRNDLARLRGSRFVSAVEPKSGCQLDEVVIKQMTGGDAVVARYLYKELFEFHPTWKVFLSTNHKPRIEDSDHAIWRRVHLVPFHVKFEGSRKDPKMGEKLSKCKEAILAWAVDGCLAWQNEGLKMPEKIQDAVDQYRREEDHFSVFLEDRCFRHPMAAVSVGNLHDSYMEWCEKYDEEPVSKNLFSQKLRQKGLVAERSAKCRYWLGLGLSKAVSLNPLVAVDDEEEVKEKEEV